MYINNIEDFQTEYLDFNEFGSWLNKDKFVELFKKYSGNSLYTLA